LALITNDAWRQFIDTLETARKVKPNVLRGENKVGFAQHYICFGIRKDPLGTDVGPYTFIPGTPIFMQKQILQQIHSMVSRFEIITNVFFNNISFLENFNRLRHEFKIPTMLQDGFCTQFSIGYNYWSPIHADDDYFYTTIACYCKDVTDATTVIYNFCFPDYGIVIPMYNGTIFVFDPKIRHSTSNPMVANAYIMSCYVSEKTVNTTIAKHQRDSLFQTTTNEDYGNSTQRASLSHDAFSDVSSSSGEINDDCDDDEEYVDE
jgi:hypothetical protein